jgi:hypothetical protein
MTVAADGRQIAFESFGVSVAVVVDDPELLPELAALAPTPSQPCEPGSVDHRLALRRTRTGLFNVRILRREGEEIAELDPTAWVAGDADLDLAMALLDAHVQSLIALHAPDHMFIRAGVVSYRDQAILLPGRPITGKSTLVRELVRAGAVAFSEDFAPVDADGRVHPYLRPAVPGVEQIAEANGDLRAQPLPVSAVVLTSYRPGAVWNPTRLSRGEAVLALISHAEPGGERPEETMRLTTRALQGDLVILQTERGEAREVAPVLLGDVEQALSGAA